MMPFNIHLGYNYNKCTMTLIYIFIIYIYNSISIFFMVLYTKPHRIRVGSINGTVHVGDAIYITCI